LDVISTLDELEFPHNMDGDFLEVLRTRQDADRERAQKISSPLLRFDRGRIVRESLAIIIADLEAKGDQSIIARRLRGR